MKIHLSPLPIAFLTCAIVSVSCAFALAAPQPADSKPLEDLGGQLLDDALLDRLLTPAESDVKPEATEPELLPSVDELRRMFDPNQQPVEGEDLGQERMPPLLSISSHMQQAGALIASQDMTGETRKVQDTIVSELDALIEKLNKQCQSCSSGQCDKPSQGQQSQSSTPKPGAGRPSNSEGSQSQPTQSQVSAGGEGEPMPGDPASVDVVKKLWGQLPERLRQQLLQSSANEFLPKYREDLEAYFKRLAEEE